MRLLISLSDLKRLKSSTASFVMEMATTRTRGPNVVHGDTGEVQYPVEYVPIIIARVRIKKYAFATRLNCSISALPRKLYLLSQGVGEEGDSRERCKLENIGHV